MVRALLHHRLTVFRLLQVSAMAWWLCAPLQGGAQTTATPGPAAEASGVLQPGEVQAGPWTLQPGDYVEGQLDSGSGRLDLELRDTHGRSLRHLVQMGQGVSAFRFVAEQGGESLVVRAPASATAAVHYSMRLTHHIGRDRQVPPPLEYRSPAIAALAAQLAAGGNSEAFWRQVATAGTPLVEPADAKRSIVTFLWRGAQRNVRLFGGPSNDHELLERLGTSDVWFKSFEVPASTRLSYQLAPDVPDVPGNAQQRRVAILATAQADPLNPHSWPADAVDRFARQSVLELPAAPLQPGMADMATARQGSLQRFAVSSKG